MVGNVAPNVNCTLRGCAGKPLDTHRIMVIHSVMLSVYFLAMVRSERDDASASPDLNCILPFAICFRRAPAPL